MKLSNFMKYAGPTITRRVAAYLEEGRSRHRRAELNEVEVAQARRAEAARTKPF